MAMFERTRRRVLNLWGWLGPSRDGVFDALPDEITAKILGQLPVREVLRCRAVCRRWQHLIDKPGFAEAHLCLCEPSVTLFQDLRFYFSGERADDELGMYLIHPRSNKKWRKEDIKRVITSRTMVPSWFVTYENPPFIRGSCNGWILFQGLVQPPRRYFICNPVTREGLLLSETLPTVCGFYFHPSKKEYRLLCAGNETEGRLSYYTCNLQLSSVKQLGRYTHKPREDVAPSPVTVDGFLYNMTDYKTVRGIYTIMMLDLDNEVLDFKPRPGSSAGAQTVPRERTCLLEAEGRVCFCCNKLGKFQIWYLEDRASWLWIKRFSIQLENVAGSSSLPQVQPIFIGDGELVLNLEGRGLVRYDTQTRKFECININTASPSSGLSDIPVGACKMSLISLSKLNC